MADRILNQITRPLTPAAFTSALLALSTLLALLLVTGCRPVESNDAAPTLSREITVTNFPLFAFTQQIVSECQSADPIQVVYIGPGPGESVDWSPSIAQIRQLQKSDVVIVNGPGAEFARWLTFVTIDDSKLCKSADTLGLDEFIVVKDFDVVHSHGPEGEHSHSWVVPNSWLDPSIARRQAKFIFDRLVATYPDDQKALEVGYRKLDSQFDPLFSSVDALREKVATLANKSVVTSDPRTKFLTRALGMEDNHLLWFESPDAESVANDLAALKKRENFVEPFGFIHLGMVRPSEIGTVIESLTPNVIEISPIEFPPSTGDYFSEMKLNLDRLTKLLEK